MHEFTFSHDFFMGLTMGLVGGAFFVISAMGIILVAAERSGNWLSVKLGETPPEFD